MGRPPQYLEHLPIGCQSLCDRPCLYSILLCARGGGVLPPKPRRSLPRLTGLCDLKHDDFRETSRGGCIRTAHAFIFEQHHLLSRAPRAARCSTNSEGLA